MFISRPSSNKSLCQRVSWQSIDRAYLHRLIYMAKEEDLAGAGFGHSPAGYGDVTTRTMIAHKNGSARIVAREDLYVCGVTLIPEILEVYAEDRHIEVDARVRDGQRIPAGREIAILRGDISTLLTAERVILNFLQHLSGIATTTARYVEALGDSPTRILDTRKTTPGFRILEKYAVACGGGWNHRMGLYDRIMIKDNHLAAAGENGGDLGSLIRRMSTEYPDLVIEVEVDEIHQIPGILRARPDVILLDNFSTDQLMEAVALIAGKCATEASGGIQLENLAELGQLGLDFISCGALTHQSTWNDIGMDWGMKE